MTVDTESLKKNTDIVKVVGSYTNLVKRGKEFVGNCVFHNDDKPSMYVTPDKGFVHCFSCGANADVIQFIMHVENVDFKEAAKILGARDNWQPSLSVPKAPPIPDRITSKPPANSQPNTFTIKGLGEPVAKWIYRDAESAILGYVCRYDTDEGKQIRIWTYGSNGKSEPSWKCGHFSYPRPLYGLDKIAKSPNNPILIVEGEKAADAAQILVPQYTSITWSAGAHAWNRCDLEILRGKKIILMPDNDDAGRVGMQKLAEVLSDKKGLNCAVRILDTEGMMPKWDIADALEDGWTPEKFIEWAKPRIKPYITVSDVVNNASHTDDLPPLPHELPRDNSNIVAIEKKPLKTPQIEKPIKPLLNLVKSQSSMNGNNALAPEADAENEAAPLSDIALADHFVEIHGENWRYVNKWNKWFEYDGHGWSQDESKKERNLVVNILKSSIYWPESASLTPDGKKKQTSSRQTGLILDAVSSHRKIAASIDQWNTDPFLLGVPNGTINLESGTLNQSRREDYITKRCLVSPESGTPKKWLSFLNMVTNHDKELLNYLQRFCGYAMSGDVSEHSLLYLYGTGGNGKGVFVDTISRILGLSNGYAYSSPINVFMQSKNERHSTELASLNGARLVTAEEPDAGSKWDEGRIKWLTGEGMVTARFLRQENFTFKPVLKLLLQGNNKPRLSGVDEAMRRRFHIVPFTVTIAQELRDHKLRDKLELEYPQILHWMMEGFSEWLIHGLNPPQSVLDSTNAYLSIEDGMGAFVDECFDLGPLKTEVNEAFRRYQEWCKSNGEYSWTKRRWINGMVERGTNKIKDGAYEYFEGMSLKAKVYSSEPMNYPQY